ncbi:hypothetical protein ACRU43_16360 [Mycobacterium colombiense]
MSTTAAEDNDDLPTPAELAGLRAHGLWMLVAGLSGDEDRVADQCGRILCTRSAEIIGTVVGDLTRRLSQALVERHGSRQAATDAITAELVAVELMASEGDSNDDD